MLNVLAAIHGTGVAASTNSYESIATVTVGAGGQAAIEFTSIPATFKHLQVRAFSRVSGGTGYANAIMNGDTTAKYSFHYLRGNGSTATAAGGANQNQYYLDSITNTASTFSGHIIDILDYTSTNKAKTVRILGGFDANGSGQIELYSGLWFATPAAVTTLKFTGSSSFQEYTKFALYGIKG